MDRARNDEERCIYRSPTGRRCRNRIAIGWNVCEAHGDFRNDYASAAEIASNRQRLDTTEGIHSSLGRIFRGVAAGKISPRQASVLTYVAQTMLMSIKGLREERQRVFDSTEEDVWRMKALADSYHDQLNCEETAENEDDEEEEDDTNDDRAAKEKSDRLAAAKAKAKGNQK